jgi:2-dehydropantoate 2-reductase
LQQDLISHTATGQGDSPAGHVAIVGAGAIGSLLGARLATAGVPVTLIGRPESMHAVQAHGLVLERPWRRPLVVRSLRAAAGWGELAAEEIASIDLAVLTTKVHDTQAAVAELSVELAPAVPLIVLQNGVGGAEIARAQAGSRPLLAAVTTLVASRPRPGVVRAWSRRGGLGLAPVEAPLDLLTRTARLFAQSGLYTQVYAEHQAMAWSKLLLNILGNAVPAIVGRPPEQVFADLALCRLELAAFREARAVMRALGLEPVGLPGYPVPALAWAIGRLPVPILHRLLPRLVGGGRGGKVPSLQMDLERGRRVSEVEYLNGAVVRAGRELGVPVPANALIQRTLSAMAQGAIPRHAYAENPHRLLAPLR